MDQTEKAERFRGLHEKETAFLIPNPWDPGSARVLEGMGFEALATTGAGYAYSIGVPDGSTSREGMLDYIRSIVDATVLPVSADLEDGFGDTPDAVAQTIIDASACGIVGGSIEDRAYGRGRMGANEFFELDQAVARVRAAVEAARSLPFRFTLTARCENFLFGRPDLEDTIRRLRAYQEAGADVLYAPGLTTSAQIRAVVEALEKPVNAIMGRAGELLSLSDLERLGVRRVSLGSTLNRTALGAFVAAAAELRDHGTCTFATRSLSHEDADQLFAT